MPYAHQPRPGEPHHFATDPTAEAMIQLFGSAPTYQGVALTEQQHRRLMETYGLDPDYHEKVRIEHQADLDARYERDTAEYDADVAAGMSKWELQRKWGYKRPERLKASGMMTEAGDTLTAYRIASRDGLRVMGFLAEYLRPGEDPVGLIQQALAALGFDVECSIEPYDDWIADQEEVD